MRINQLRGSVADRPIDARVVPTDSHSTPMMDQIVAARPQVQQVDVSRLSAYDKG